MSLYAYLDDDLVSMHLSERLLSFESEVAEMSVKVYVYGTVHKLCRLGRRGGG